MKKQKYKSYSLQGSECRKNGNRFSVFCYTCNQEVLVCQKYKEVCNSKACFKERTT